MRKGITIEVSAADRARLEAVVADRNSPQKHVWRAGIILADRRRPRHGRDHAPDGQVQACVWRWQERFMPRGCDGLLRDKTRPSRIPPLGAEVAERVVALTLTDPPARGDPLDRRDDGEGGRHQRQFGAAHLARARAPAAPGPAVQALQRSAVRRQAARRRRALSSTRRRTPSCSRSTRRARSRRSTAPSPACR